MNCQSLKILFAIAWVLFPLKPAIPQTGNMSDITGANMDAIVPVAPTSSDGETFLPSAPPPSDDDNLRPPPDGRQPPPDGQQPPPDGRQPPPDGQQPPPDGRRQPPPDGRQLPPPDGQQLPPDGRQQPPPDGQQPPPDGQQPPPDGQQLPQNGQQLPPDGRQLPQNGQQLPQNGQQLPQNGRQPLPRNQQEPIQLHNFDQPPQQQAPPPGQQNQTSNKPGEKPSQQKQPQQMQPRGQQQVDRPAYEAQLQQVEVGGAVQLIEEYQAVEFSDYLGVELFGEVPSFDEISATLYDLWQVTGQKAAFVYVSASDRQLDLFIVMPSPSGTASVTPQLLASTRPIPGVIVAQTQGPIQHLQLSDVKGNKLRETVQEFRQQITDPRYRRSPKYLENAQQLYQWLIAPMDAQLSAQGIDILVVSMDAGLRSLPIAALHDGEQFLVEKYGLALVPSFGLTDVSYFDVRQAPILAMGASEFTELSPLPAVPIEVENILRKNWQGQSFLNQDFTVEIFREKNQEERFGIIHLATHGEFETGNLSDSYIQFYDRKMNMVELRQIANELGWSQIENTPIELLVLSACRTAVGSPEAELGFAGLAVQAGVKSALASLWYVSDAGTLGLMSEFYQQLSETPIKSQALRQTQIAMLKGELRIENGRLRLSNGETLPLTPELAAAGNFDLSHPYFWSAFMMIGNWN